MNYLKLTFRILLSLFLISFVLGSIYVTNTLNEVDLEPFEKIQRNENDSMGQSFFEKGSLLDKDEFLFYLSFIYQKEGNVSLRRLEDQGAVEVAENQIKVMKDFSLPALQENDCSKLYCFQHYLRFTEVPSAMWKGLIGVEDLRFLDHSGVDFKAILRAIIVDIKEMKMVQGGSTLTQQLVKNLYLTSEKTFSRKIKELIIAVYLEYKYEKEDILELYFNEVFWGSMHGLQIKGLYSASVFYFQKSPKELNPYESSILVSLLKGPSFYSPLKRLDRLKKRTNLVYDGLKNKSLVPLRGQYKWNDVEWLDWQKRISSKLYGIKLKAFWWTSTEEKTDFEDYEKFTLKVKALERLNVLNNSNLAFKGYIKNLKSNATYEFYSKYERSLKTAFNDEAHQIGSTIKPIIYDLISSRGIDWSEKVSLEPITLNLISGKWTPSEASRKKINELSVGEALQQSKNTAIIRLASQIGFDELEKDLEVYFPDIKKPLKEYPAQLLGAIELPISRYGEVYEKFLRSACKRESKVIEIMSDPRLTTIRNVADKRIAHMSFFGKTGTTNKGYDNWFVAFDGESLFIFWTGFEGVRSGKDLKIYGSTSSFKIFNDFVLNKGKRFTELNCEIFSGKN